MGAGLVGAREGHQGSKGAKGSNGKTDRKDKKRKKRRGNQGRQLESVDGSTSIQDWIVNTLPTLRNPPLECTQQAGEVMFVPPMWHHGTISLTVRPQFPLTIYTHRFMKI